MRISIVIPFYNEADNVLPLADEIAQACRPWPDFEALFIDDGSTDTTWPRIQESARKHAFIRGLRSLTNCGQTSALLLGLLQSRGDVLVTLDGDLQNNPADIPMLVERLAACDVVCGYRAKRRDSWSRRAASRIGNRIRNWVTHDGLRDTGCSLKAFHRKCLADLPFINGAHRFMGAYFRLHGRTIEQVPVDHRHRQHGQSKYTNLKRLPRTTFDLLGFAWYRSRLLTLPEFEQTR